MQPLSPCGAERQREPPPARPLTIPKRPRVEIQALSPPPVSKPRLPAVPLARGRTHATAIVSEPGAIHSLRLACLAGCRNGLGEGGGGVHPLPECLPGNPTSRGRLAVGASLRQFPQGDSVPPVPCHAGDGALNQTLCQFRAWPGAWMASTDRVTLCIVFQPHFGTISRILAQRGANGAEAAVVEIPLKHKGKPLSSKEYG